MATPFLGNLYNADTIANLEAQYGLGGSGLPSQARHQAAMNELSKTLSPGVVPEWMGDVGAFTAGAIAEIPDFLQTGDWRESGRDIKDNFIGSFLTSQDETPEDIYAKIYAPQKQYQKGIAQAAMQKKIQQAQTTSGGGGGGTPPGGGWQPDYSGAVAHQQQEAAKAGQTHEQFMSDLNEVRAKGGRVGYLDGGLAGLAYLLYRGLV